MEPIYGEQTPKGKSVHIPYMTPRLKGKRVFIRYILSFLVGGSGVCIPCSPWKRGGFALQPVRLVQCFFHLSDIREICDY